MNLVFLGPPGAGKGTQAALLSKDCGLVHIASGDLFRQAVESGDDLGKRVKEYMERGLLVPDDIVIALILRRLASLDKDRGFVLDGFPRTLEQAKSLDKALAEENRLLDGVVYISVSTDELVRRLSGRRTCKRCQSPYNIWTSPPKVEGKCDHCGGELYQRPDDHEEAVRKRLEVFLNHTAPLLDYYNDKGNLIKVNGEQGVMEVAQEIKKALWG